MFKEFRTFVMRGNVIDLAVGVIIGAAFGTVVKSLVDDIIMPPIGLATGGVDFVNHYAVLRPGLAAPGPYPTLAAAKAAGAVTVNYGAFVSTLITFLIVALAVFLVVRVVNRYYGKPVAAKPCPYCTSSIPLAATRCPHCTSQLGAVATGA